MDWNVCGSTLLKSPDWRRPKQLPGVEGLDAVRNGTAAGLSEALSCGTARTRLANGLLSERSQTPKTTDSAIYMAALKTRKTL